MKLATQKTPTCLLFLINVVFILSTRKRKYFAFSHLYDLQQSGSSEYFWNACFLELLLLALHFIDYSYMIQCNLTKGVRCSHCSNLTYLHVWIKLQKKIIWNATCRSSRFWRSASAVLSTLWDTRCYLLTCELFKETASTWARWRRWENVWLLH